MQKKKKKKKSYAANKAFIRWAGGQAWFWSQNLITNNPKHSSSFLEYHQTMFIFSHIMGMTNQNAALLNNPLLYS